MAHAATETPSRDVARRAPARHRRLLWAAIALTALAAIAVGVAVSIEEPLRRRMEADLNRQMQGYTVTLTALELHPFSFSLSLLDPIVRQNAHPEPPVLRIDALDAGVHWRALLSLRLVADFHLRAPRIHVNRPQLAAESADQVPVEDKGWQQALESIYPLKINEFRISDGALTYVDDDPKRPLELTRVDMVATNIRNIRAPDSDYPSPIRLSAALFDQGRLRVDGDANFLAEPHPGVRAALELTTVPLDKLRPVADNANIHIKGGILAALGDVEYAPQRKSAHLRRASIDDIAVDYVHSPQTAVAESKRMDKVRATADELAKEPDVALVIDELTVNRAVLGYVDQTADPDYRLFLADAAIELRDLSNAAEPRRGVLKASGRFMGSGAAKLQAGFLPRRTDPDMDVALQIEHTDLNTLNDLFKAYAGVDVVGGEFSFYTQLRIADAKINGYVKPMFRDVDVYDRRQDATDSLPHKLYEGVVGGVATLLENRRDDVATQAAVRGSASSPELSTFEVVVNLIRNAFFKSILPGFEESTRRRQG